MRGSGKNPRASNGGDYTYKQFTIPLDVVTRKTIATTGGFLILLASPLVAVALLGIILTAIKILGIILSIKE